MPDITITPHYEMLVLIGGDITSAGPFPFFIPFNYSGVKFPATATGPSCVIRDQVDEYGKKVPTTVKPDSPSYSEGPTVKFNADGMTGIITGKVNIPSLDPSIAAFLLNLSIPLGLSINSDGSSSFGLYHSRIIKAPQTGSDDVMISVKSNHKHKSHTSQLIGVPRNFPANLNATAAINNQLVKTPHRDANHFDVTVDVPISVTVSSVPPVNDSFLAVIFALNLVFGAQMLSPA